MPSLACFSMLCTGEKLLCTGEKRFHCPSAFHLPRKVKRSGPAQQVGGCRRHRGEAPPMEPKRGPVWIPSERGGFRNGNAAMTVDASVGSSENARLKDIFPQRRQASYTPSERAPRRFVQPGRCIWPKAKI